MENHEKNRVIQLPKIEYSFGEFIIMAVMMLLFFYIILWGLMWGALWVVDAIGKAIV